MSSASVLVCLSSGLLPEGPVMSPIKCLGIFFKLEAGGLFFLLSVMHLLRRHSSEKMQPGYVFGDIYIRQCFSFT